MTARGSHNGSPHTVAHHRLPGNGNVVTPGREKLRRTAVAPPLTIPTAEASCEGFPQKRLPSSRKRRRGTRSVLCAATTTTTTTTTTTKCAIGCGVILLFSVTILVLWSGGHLVWQQFTTILVGDDGGGFRPDEEFLTAEDYAATLEPGKPNGAACYTAANCLEGSICAFPTLHNNSARICCADAVILNDGADSSNNNTATGNAGTKKFHFDSNSNNDEINSPWLSVCTGAKIGEHCGTYDAICESGHCLFGRCAAAPLSDKEICQDDADCASGACAFYGDDLRDDPRCCPGGRAVIVKPDGVPFDISYCADLPDGVFCGERDELCASGWCSHGICRDPNTKRQRQFPSVHDIGTVEMEKVL